MPDTPANDALEQFLDDHRDERLESFKALLRIPSISALREHAPDVRRTAAALAADLRAIGFDRVQASADEGAPIVYAEWLRAPGAPTVVAYGHYDVQPVDPIDMWRSEPFDPQVRNGRMYARGAADDKGQVHMHIRAAEALLRTTGRLPVNLKFVFEGEEETSSEHLASWLETNRDLVAADVAVISDSGFFDGNRPALTLGLRGIMYAQIDVVGPEVDLHSGAYGGVVENPAIALTRIIAGLKGPDGRITIPGFYDDVVELDEAERSQIAELPFDEAAYLSMIGVPALVGEPGYSPLERRGTRPTLDVNGIWGGFEGEGAKTIIPAHAHAKVSCRLVPNQDPDRIFALLRDQVAQLTPAGVRVSVEALGGGRPSLTPRDHPATEAAARAIERAFGAAPLYIREGGSIPVCAMFEEQLDLPVVLFGFSNPDDNAHAPNESLILDNYERGIRAIAYLWQELAANGLA